MKNKNKNFFIILLTLITLFSLAKMGKVLAGEETFKLTNATIEDKSATVDAEIEGIAGSVVNSKATFHKLDDYVIYKITIKNTSSKTYDLKSIEGNDNNSYLIYDYTYDTSKLEPSETKDVLIKVTYKNEVEDISKRTQDEDIKVTFSFEGEDGEIVTEDVVINPKTHDNLLLYVSLFAICSISLITITVKNKKVKKVLVTVIFAIPFITRAAQFGLIIDFKNEIKLNDKLVVTYIVNGEKQTKVVNYDDKTTEPSAPTKPGYNFIGWYNGEEKFDFTNTKIEDDVNIIAKYEPIQYNINVDLKGGSGRTSYEYNIETNDFDLEIPTKAGYSFAGWTGDNGNTLQNRITIYKGTTGNKSYTANWDTRDDVEFTVTHKYENLNGGYDSETEIGHGVTETTVYPAIRHRTGFADPTTKSLFIKADGTAELEYTYLRETYSLTLQNSSDIQTTISNGTYPYGTPVTLTAKNKTGYTFTGWSNGETANPLTFNLTENTTIAPEYSINKYTLTLQNSEYITTSTASGQYDYNTEITLTANNREGYTFTGWSNGETNQTITFNLTEDTTISPEYSINKYTFSYENNEYVTSSIEAGQYDYNTEITLTAAERTGYTFTGWSNGETANPLTFNLTENTIITPEYSINKYTLTLQNSEYITTSTASGQYDYNTEITLTANNREGYTFTGWSNGETTQTITFNLTENTTITPEYSVNKYTLTLQNTEFIETATTSGQYDYNTEITVTAKDRVGYTFANWSTGNTNKVYTFNLIQDLTLFPEYNINRYTFSYGSNEYVTSNVTEGEYDYNTEVTLTAAERTGYTFTGWSNGETANPLTFNLTANTTISPEYEINSYDVTFNGNDGTPTTTIITKEYNQTITENELPTVTREGYKFIGWFTDAENGDQTEAPITVTGETTYYAHWKQNPICYRAKVLHHEDCERIDSRGCVADGLTGNNRTTVYGTIVDHNGYIPGDAFDCDVNGNGQIDLDQNGDSLERFYYLRNVDDDHAALIYYINVVNGENNQGVAIPYDASNRNYVEPTALLSNLPTNWTTVELTNATEQIVNEQGIAMSKSQALPTFNYSAYTSRMPVVEDIKAACGLTNVPTQTPVTIPVEFNTGCGFLFENTTYMNPTVKSGYWLMTPTSSNNSSVFRLTGETHQLGNTQASNSTGAGIRPVIEVPLDRMQEPYADNEFGVPFDIRGGITAIPLYERTVGSTLGELPDDPVKPGYIFLGWYMDMDYTIPATPDTPVDEHSVVYARWESTTAVATRGNKSYDTLAEAVNDTTNNGKNIIDLIKDVEEPITVPNREIEINMNSHTISVTSDECVFANKLGGTLILRDGILTTTASTKAAIDNESGSKVYLSNVTIEATGSRAALYNKDSKAYILNNSSLYTEAPERAAIQNLGTGELYFISGEATSKNKQGILNENRLVIGEDDADAHNDNPVISGKTYAITSNKSFYIYDGKLRSESANIVDNIAYLTTDGAIETEPGNETVDTNWGSATYNYLDMKNSTTKYRITLDPLGGEVNPNSITIDAGNAVGELPTPTKGIYTFDDWYKEDTFANKVTTGTVPTGNSTYYAKWNYIVSNEVITFNSTNNAMKSYYDNVSTWKADSTNYESTMLQNFLDNECHCEGNTCESPGTVYCDKPKGYDTTTGEDLNLYLYNESTSERGELVTYAKIENGVIYNLIPNQTYNWELKSDSNVHGFIKFTETRRIIDAGNIRNVRDLGGLSATYVDSETHQEVSGTLNYGRLFRGFKLSASASDLTELTKLGIDEELDLRGTNNENEQKLDNYKLRDVAGYQIDKETHLDNYNSARAVVKETMQDVINGKNIYIHCGGGTDRAGTLAYILEGLLGVPEEERLQDYDLSFFYGLINRHRYFSEDENSNEKFVYMHNLLDTNQKIYDWYMAGTDNEDADIALINNFRKAMVKSY